MRIGPTLRLACKHCGWKPEESQTMREVQQHMISAHRTDKVDLDLIATCTCGSEMTFKFSEPTGDDFRDHFACPMDGNEGFIVRSKAKPAARGAP